MVALYARAGIETSLEPFQVNPLQLPSTRGQELKHRLTVQIMFPVELPSTRGQELKPFLMPIFKGVIRCPLREGRN